MSQRVYNKKTTKTLKNNQEKAKSNTLLNNEHHFKQGSVVIRKSKPTLNPGLLTPQQLYPSSWRH